MLHLHSRAAMARVLTLNLDPQLRTLLIKRAASLITPDYDLTDDTEYLIVGPGDTEADIVRHVGFSPLIEPIDGARFGTDGFSPFWDWLTDHGGWYEMIVSFGSTFAYVLFVQDADDGLSDLRALCDRYAREPRQ